LNCTKCTYKNNISENKSLKSNKMTNFSPFVLSNNNGQHSITAAIESAELFVKYSPSFEKYDYSGNGYSWEGHITQILEKISPDLLQHIEFDPEAGAFYAYADTQENQIKFVELLSPIFTDLIKLEDYLKKADRSRIDD
jgi:Immunity protein 51